MFIPEAIEAAVLGLVVSERQCLRGYLLGQLDLEQVKIKVSPETCRWVVSTINQKRLEGGDADSFLSRVDDLVRTKQEGVA